MAMTKPAPPLAQGLVEIGATAGVVWNYLRDHGATTQTKLIKEIGLPRELVLKAIGWLAREDKLMITGARTINIELRPEPEVEAEPPEV